MIPVCAVIPALNASSTIEAAISSVRPSVERLIVVDGGSSDGTPSVAAAAGASVVLAPRGRGVQLAAGAAAAGADSAWLLFLHADTVLQDGWAEEAAAFLAGPEAQETAAAFCFVLDDSSRPARIIERGVARRCRMLGMPYGDQGLLISRTLFDAVGGFRPYPLFEDVDIVRRIGRARIRMLESAAVTSAERYRRSGYIVRPMRNLALLALYFCGVPPRLLARLYG